MGPPWHFAQMQCDDYARGGWRRQKGLLSIEKANGTGELKVIPGASRSSGVLGGVSESEQRVGETIPQLVKRFPSCMTDPFCAGRLPRPLTQPRNLQNRRTLRGTK